jgi:glycosyltransferase involved in cell wall biosynthesis
MMAQRRARVLHVIGTLDPGGTETWLLNTLKHIDRDLLEFHFCTFGPQPGLFAGEVERFGGRILPCPRGQNPWSFGRRFRKILREGKYDAVHSHVTLFSGAVLRWAYAERVTMRIAHSHATRDDKPSTQARRYYRRTMKSWIDRYATHGLAVSKSAAANLFGQNWESDGRFRVLHCGIDLQPFQVPVARDQVRTDLGLPIGVPVFGHVGRFHLQKNHPFLLEVFGEIQKRIPHAHFLLVGDGPLRGQIEARSKAMGLSSKMHFVGIRTDVPRLMRGGMDVFIFPSIFEGLPIAVLEAQAAGLCCLISSSISREVAAGPEVVAFMDLSATPRDWAEQSVQLLERERVAECIALQTIAGSPFSVQHCIKNLARIYKLEERQYSSEEALTI